MCRGGHEAIVTEQELQEIQDMAQKRQKILYGQTPSSENIFAGLIRCGIVVGKCGYGQNTKKNRFIVEALQQPQMLPVIQRNISRKTWKNWC